MPTSTKALKPDASLLDFSLHFVENSRLPQLPRSLGESKVRPPRFPITYSPSWDHSARRQLDRERVFDVWRNACAEQTVIHEPANVKKLLLTTTTLAYLLHNAVVTAIQTDAEF